MTYLALVSARDGRRAGAATVAGIALGLAVVGAVAALGVASLVQSSAAIYEALRWSGVLFLLYLAWEGWRRDGETAPGERFTSHFAKGLFTNLLNPKAAIFYVSAPPTFIDEASDATRQALALTTIYVAVATTIHAAIVVLAGAIELYLSNPTRKKVARRVLSGLLAAVAIWFAWSSKR